MIWLKHQPGVDCPITLRKLYVKEQLMNFGLTASLFKERLMKVLQKKIKRRVSKRENPNGLSSYRRNVLALRNYCLSLLKSW